MTTTPAETWILMDSLKNCRKAISQAVPFSKQDAILQRIQDDIIAELEEEKNPIFAHAIRLTSYWNAKLKVNKTSI
jgi:hypothetical protein